MSLDSKTIKKVNYLVGMLGMLGQAIEELKAQRANFTYLRNDINKVKSLIIESPFTMLNKVVDKNITLEKKIIKLKNDNKKRRLK